MISRAYLRDVCASKFGHQLLSRHMSSLSLVKLENTPPIPLLGPPEVYLQSTPSKSAETNPSPPKPSDPFIDLMVSHYNNKEIVFPSSPFYAPSYRPYMGYTENCSPTFLSSGNACLDFFFHIVPNTPPNQVKERLQKAWDENPLTALKLVLNLRGVRGKGKADREGFYAAALWLHEKHPKTLAYNALSVAEFGYFKDLLEILYRILEGPDVQKKQREEYEKRKYNNLYYGRPKSEVPSHARRPKRILEEQKINSAKKGLERYSNDPDYRFLHNQVSRVFADALRADLENMREGNLRNISLAAKWCPSLYSIFDRSILMCEAIARRLFPRESFPEYEGLEEAHYTYRIRLRLRKEVLVSLRKTLNLPEVYMSAKQWDLVRYNMVPSVAMKNYRETFFKHDGERFKGYLKEVKKGKKKIAAGALLPHEIIAALRKADRSCGYGGYDTSYSSDYASDDDNDNANDDVSYDGVYSKDDGNDDGVNANEVLELQWKRMVDDLKEIGKLNNCLAICDVSGSMCGTPLEVSVALGLLISDLSEEPWKGKLITFSENPQLQIIEGDSLLSKVNSTEKMHWEMNTNFQRAFDKILEVVKNGNLTQDQMVKRLFVFSDMEFDQASSRPWETDYEAICRKFEENGYKSVPEIVFWNLRNSDATPVPSHQQGVALVSGFSKNLVKCFMQEGGVTNPELVMENAISGSEYDNLVVVD